jgi:hypothetical protein
VESRKGKSVYQEYHGTRTYVRTYTCSTYEYHTKVLLPISWYHGTRVVRTRVLEHQVL